ncbi:MAG: hybrid sensor histidine kinase/response regulator, partial [Chlorobiales bacterium]|nr:hybrid sensor histidine kinase/response regulator [Chlorobiales bacterium]
MKVIAYIRKCFWEGTQISRFNILSAALLGAPAHMFFYFLFKYIFHLPYESLALRLTASFLSFLAFIFGSSKTKFAQKFFPIYWHFSIIFVLPFIFTVYLLKNDFHELWLYWEIFMIFILMAYVPNWLTFLFDLLVGVFAAILFFVVTSPGVQLNPDFNIPLYSIVIF